MNFLVENVVGLLTAYYTGDGKTKVNLFYKAADFVQLSKIRIKVKTPLISDRGFELAYLYFFTDVS